MALGNSETKSTKRRKKTVILYILFIIGRNLLLRSGPSTFSGRHLLFGLYDTDGILRFIGGDREACLAYAELFDLQKSGCSLLSLPEPHQVAIKRRNRKHLAVSSN